MRQKKRKMVRLAAAVIPAASGAAP